MSDYIKKTSIVGFVAKSTPSTSTTWMYLGIWEVVKLPEKVCYWVYRKWRNSTNIEYSYIIEDVVRGYVFCVVLIW